MKKMRLAGTSIVAMVLLSGLFGGNIQGANGGQLSGGACAPKTPADFIFDSDKDGISDDTDNCPSAFNPNQNDEDKNGIGEICEFFKPFDGKIECELPTCNAPEDCNTVLEDQCPEGQIELDFLGLFLVCCDNVCTVADTSSDTSVCPAGSCAAPFPHCSNEQDCLDLGFINCFEGCCGGEIFIPNPCDCECPPEDPDCECPPCEIECPNGGSAPQCETGEQCAPGELCNELGCCIQDG